MTALDCLLIILGVLAVIPCSYLYYKDRGNAYKVLMFLSFIAGPIWAVSIVFFRNASSLDGILSSAKIIYINSILLGLLFFLFQQYFPRKKLHKSFMNILVYGSALFLAYSILFTNWFIETPILYDTNSLELGKAYLVWMVWMLGIFSFGFINILIDYRNLGKIERIQLQYFIIAILVPIVGVIPTNAILPMLGDFRFIWIGPLAMCTMSLILTFGVATKNSYNKYHIQITIINVFALLLYVLEIVFLTLLILNNHLNIGNFVEEIIWILIFLLIALVSYFLGKMIVDKSIYFIFKEKIPNYNYIRNRYLDITAELLNTDELINITLQEIIKAVSITWCEAILSEDKGNKKYSLLNKKLSINKITENPKVLLSNLKEVLIELNGVCNRDALEYILNNEYYKYSPKLLKRMEHISNYLQSITASEAMLINIDNDSSVLFLIGYKKGTASSINPRERDFISSVLKNLSLGLSRAKLHTEVEIANNSLQKRVSEQTAELQKKVKELEEARKKESDMIDIMGHELRTPASIVKINIEMLKKYIAKNPPEFKTNIERISNAIDSEIKLINTLLTSAKLEGKKIQLNFEDVDIKNEIAMSIHAFEQTAQEKNLQLLDQTDSNTPHIFADKARTIEILNNLIENAIKYTHKGHVIIKTTKEDNFVRVDVIDTGEGIPQDELEKLGDKFHRVENYIDKKESIVRPGGSGLGLYVTFNLVKIMGGEINVTSKVGQGTTFSFKLPIFKEDKIVKRDGEEKDLFKRYGLKTK